MVGFLAVVYIDVLFLINALGDFVILKTCAHLLRLSVPLSRMICGALLGGVYGVAELFPSLAFLYTPCTKVMASVFFTAFIFRTRSVRLFLKTLAVFYGVTALLGGGIFALFYLVREGKIQNGSMDFSVPWGMTALILFLAYPCVRFLFRTVRGRTGSGREMVDVGVTLCGKTARLTALVDTGNHLKEPISAEPVMIAEFRELRSILPEEFCENFSAKAKGEAVEVLLYNKTDMHLRPVPFRTLGSENGMLPAFRPDAVFKESEGKKESLMPLWIALSSVPLSGDRKYGALLSPEICAPQKGEQQCVNGLQVR